MSLGVVRLPPTACLGSYGGYGPVSAPAALARPAFGSSVSSVGSFVPAPSSLSPAGHPATVPALTTSYGALPATVVSSGHYGSPSAAVPIVSCGSPMAAVTGSRIVSCGSPMAAVPVASSPHNSPLAAAPGSPMLHPGSPMHAAQPSLAATAGAMGASPAAGWMRFSTVPPGSEALVAGERVVMPAQPGSLTTGVATPQEISRQKEEYNRSLEEQEQQGREALDFQTQRQREFIRMQAEQQKQIAAGRWDQHLRAQEMAAEQEYQQQLAMLREAAAQLRGALENQASQLVVEYSARKAQEELNQKVYEAELREWEMARHLTPEQLLNAEERLQAQLAFAAQRNTTSVRKDKALPELPLSRWVPEGMGHYGATFGGVAQLHPGLKSPDLATHWKEHLATQNASPYPVGCALDADPDFMPSGFGAGGLHSSAAY